MVIHLVETAICFQLCISPHPTEKEVLLDYPNPAPLRPPPTSSDLIRPHPTSSGLLRSLLTAMLLLHRGIVATVRAVGPHPALIGCCNVSANHWLLSSIFMNNLSSNFDRLVVI